MTADALRVSTTLADTLRAAAARTPDRIILVDGPTRITCAGLYASATALARNLLSRIPVGSVVSFMLPNWHEAAVVYLGATLAGMVVNPILPSLRDRELSFILDDVDSRMIFVPGEFRGHDYVAMLERVTSQLPTPPEVVVVRGSGHTPYSSLLEPTAGADSFPQLDSDAVRMILYTSGTTGRPKGVMHSHNSLHALIRQIGEHWLVEAGDKFLVPSPIAHIGGSIYAFECPLLLGTTAVLMDRWEPAEAVTLMTAERCTHMAGATPFLTQLLAAARDADTRLPDLKVFICGGASVSPSLIRSATDYFGQAVVSRVYGSTEVPVTTVGAIQPGDTGHAADTDGRPGIADVRLVDGEIRARGAQMLLGYLHPEDNTTPLMPTDTSAPATSAPGSTTTTSWSPAVPRTSSSETGRTSRPRRSRICSITEPGIAEIAVVGVPDPRTGERACAVIVPGSGPAPDVEELRRVLGAHGVATFKVPERVEIWDALPKNDAGKVLKHQIRAALMEGQECR